jgi:hypothetical protein
MGGSRSTFTIQEILEAKAEEKWRQKGIPEQDIELSRLTGMDAGDIRGFRKFTAQHPGYLIIVRCPKVTARPHHAIFPPKPGYASGSKSGDSGLLPFDKPVTLADGTKTTEKRIFVSDYDLMSVWRRGPKGFEKIVVTAEGGRKKGPLSPDATVVIRHLNWCMESRSRIVHGCQDDWISKEHNPGVKAGSRFAAFNLGAGEYIDSPAGLEQYYAKFHLPWPYDNTGKHKASLLA